MFYIWVAVVFIFLNGYMNFRKTGRFVPAFYLSVNHRQYLEKYFEFYLKLPPKSKAIFERRVTRFISDKKFIPRDMPTVTDEMKALIAASATQITFGFPQVNLSFFQNILVYPDDYYSTINKKYHKGEVNPRFRVIVLSWKSFVTGYLQKDGRNLGLHEMAHALRLENKIQNQEYDFLDQGILDEWEKCAAQTIQEIREGKETFFREYGATDSDEFFAVCVENFFERPSAFYETHPRTYRMMCHLLNQDPLILEKR